MNIIYIHTLIIFYKFFNTGPTVYPPPHTLNTLTMNEPFSEYTHFKDQLMCDLYLDLTNLVKKGKLS